MEMEKVRLIKRQHEQALLDIDGVVGVGVALSPNGEPCIKAYLKVKASAVQGKVPKRLDGVPVILEEIGKVIPY